MTKRIDNLLIVEDVVCCNQRSDDLEPISIVIMRSSSFLHYLSDIHHVVEYAAVLVLVLVSCVIGKEYFPSYVKTW